MTADDYTPSMDEWREAYCPVHGDNLNGKRTLRCAIAPAGHEYAAHDAELRAEIAAAIRAEIITGADACNQPNDPCPTCGAAERAYKAAATIAEGRTDRERDREQMDW